MSRKIVAGNWKMNTTLPEAKELSNNIINNLSPSDPLTVLAPPAPFLVAAAEAASGSDRVKVAAQNCSQHESGAFTGDYSAAMIASTGAEMVIIGHSERRQYYKENELVLSEKINKALKHNLVPIYCVGESKEQRESGTFKKVIEDQIAKATFHLSENEMSKLVIAYEPVWAIGTGLTATPEQAEEVHAFIRDLIKDQYGEKIASGISVIYGGSCKPENAADLFAQKNIDGGLIGGASLKAADFSKIIEALKNS